MASSEEMMPTNQDETLYERYQREAEVNARLEQAEKDRTEIIALAKQHGAVTNVRSLTCDSNDGIVMFPEELEDFFHAAQREALTQAAAYKRGVEDATKPAYTTGHCKNKSQPGGCQLHNLQCGYPDCDRKES